MSARKRRNAFSAKVDGSLDAAEKPGMLILYSYRISTFCANLDIIEPRSGRTAVAAFARGFGLNQ